MKTTDLSLFDNRHYHPGKNLIVRAIWYGISWMFFESRFPFYAPKRILLRCFGGKVGKNVVIKPRVYIKYPWKLNIRDYSWIGEEVRIDNLDEVRIGRNVCISQRAFLLCGNHNYKSESFNLITKPIVIEDGVWVGAGAIVGPGSVLKSHSVLTMGCVWNGNTDSYTIYSGNPAREIRKRIIE